MSDKFTPGPLCVEDCTSAESVDVCLAYDVPGGGSPIMIATCFFDEDDVPAPITRSQAIANAKLFAAAPDLYAALVELAASVRGKGPRDGKTLSRADAAIAKAT